MRGIQFVVDDAGNRKAVQIDLEAWGEVWEDFYDALLVAERAKEPDEQWSVVRDRLIEHDKISE